ncbi:MAG: SxtJ family membrane protein [Pseudomonadota bacterium]|nr:SxtJ family membrane protein [Pseudomonadota bacterium]
MTEMPVAVEKKALREFGLVTGGIVAVLFGLVLPWLFGAAEFPRWPWFVGALLATWGLSWPAGLGPVYRGWMKLGHALGWVNTRILLGILFFLLFLPAGLIMRLLGKDPMARKRDSGATSYRVASKDQPRDHLERPY